MKKRRIALIASSFVLASCTAIGNNGFGGLILGSDGFVSYTSVSEGESSSQINIVMVNADGTTSSAKANESGNAYRLVATPSNDRLFFAWSYKSEYEPDSLISKDATTILQKSDLKSSVIYALFQERHVLTIDPNGGVAEETKIEYGIQYEPFDTSSIKVTRDGYVFSGFIDQYDIACSEISESSLYCPKTLKAMWNKQFDSLAGTSWSVSRADYTESYPMTFQFSEKNVQIYFEFNGTHFNAGRYFALNYYLADTKEGSLDMLDLSKDTDDLDFFRYTYDKSTGLILITINVSSTPELPSFNERLKGIEYVFILEYKDGKMNCLKYPYSFYDTIVGDFSTTPNASFNEIGFFLTSDDKFVRKIPSLNDTNLIRCPTNLVGDANNPFVPNKYKNGTHGIALEIGYLDPFGFLHAGTIDDDGKTMVFDPYMTQYIAGSFGYYALGSTLGGTFGNYLTSNPKPILITDTTVTLYLHIDGMDYINDTGLMASSEETTFFEETAMTFNIIKGVTDWRVSR